MCKCGSINHPQIRNMTLLNTSVAGTHSDRTNGETAAWIKESSKDKEWSEWINGHVSVFLSTFSVRPFQVPPPQCCRIYWLILLSDHWIFLNVQRWNVVSFEPLLLYFRNILCPVSDCFWIDDHLWSSLLVWALIWRSWYRRDFIGGDW